MRVGTLRRNMEPEVIRTQRCIKSPCELLKLNGKYIYYTNIRRISVYDRADCLDFGGVDILVCVSIRYIIRLLTSTKVTLHFDAVVSIWLWFLYTASDRFHSSSPMLNIVDGPVAIVTYFFTNFWNCFVLKKANYLNWRHLSARRTIRRKTWDYQVAVPVQA